MAKRHFVQSAKDVANSTANLVKEIKALDTDYTDANRKRCADATKPLLGECLKKKVTSIASNCVL